MKTAHIVSAKFTSIGDMAITQCLEKEMLRRGFILTPFYDQVDCVVLGPGGLLYSRESEQSHVFEDKKVDLRLHDINTALKAGEKFVALGVGNQIFEANQSFWAETLSRAEFISVRDVGSKIDTEKQLGRSFPNMNAVGDFGFDLYDKKSNYEKPLYPKTLVISIRTEEDEETCKTTHEVLTELQKQGYEFVWAPHGRKDWENYLTDYLPHYGGQIIGKTFEKTFLPEPHKYLEALRCCAGSVTHRLHGIIFGIVTGRPVLGLTKENEKNIYQMHHLFGDKGYPYWSSRKNTTEALGAFDKMMKEDCYEQFCTVASEEKNKIANHFTWVPKCD